MGKPRLFFPQSALDAWLYDSKVDLSGDELTLLSQSRKYRIVEAFHVLREVAGAGDPLELVGRVKTRAYLEGMEAELLEGSMILGDGAYDVVPGFIAAPTETFAEHRAAGHSAPFHSEEEMVAGFASESPA